MTPAHQAALAHLQAGRLAEADAIVAALLTRNPADAEALHLRGLLLARAGRVDEALGHLDRAITVDSRHPGYLANRAAVLSQAGRLADAERDVRRALMIEARMPQAVSLLGSLLRQQGRHDEATAAFRRALQMDPRSAEAQVGLGLALQARGDEAAALAAFDAAVAAHPRNASAAYHRGSLTLASGRFGDAARDFERVLAIDPSHAGARNNLAVAFLHQGNAAKDRDDLALAGQCFERVLVLQPGQPDALNNLANLAFEAGDLAGAERLYLRALEAQPAFTDARFGLGQVALFRRDYAAGWPAYELRFDTTNPVARRPGLPLPLVTSLDEARGRRIAVWSEQGIGDAVLYSTLLPEFAEVAAQVVLQVTPRLVSLYRRSFPGLQVVGPDEAPEAHAACDVQVGLGSLGHLLRADRGAFSRQPRSILVADPERVARLRAELGDSPPIALSWRSLQAGGRRFLERRKSMPVEDVARLLGAVPARWLDVQYGNVDEDRAELEGLRPGTLERVEGLDAREDLEGLAAALVACGRLVTVCNATAHLAGALGVPTLVAYPDGRAPFHYWVAGEDGRCPWYPSVEIVTGAGWAPATDAIARRLSGK